ncbi:MAG: hypothetical protein ABIN58_00235, partial [candidate division WOR-3 bacterium]
KEFLRSFQLSLGCFQFNLASAHFQEPALLIGYRRLLGHAHVPEEASKQEPGEKTQFGSREQLHRIAAILKPPSAPMPREQHRYGNLAK